MSVQQRSESSQQEFELVPDHECVSSSPPQSSPKGAPNEDNDVEPRKARSIISMAAMRSGVPGIMLAALSLGFIAFGIVVHKHDSFPARDQESKDLLQVAKAVRSLSESIWRYMWLN